MLITPIQESRFKYRGYDCVVLFMPMCFRCGYIAIPSNHKYYKVMYDNIDIKCHGGLTYSKDYLFGQTDENIWWIGFDCSHSRDGYDWDAGKKHWKNNYEQLEFIEDEEKFHKKIGDIQLPKTLKYVEDECKSIVDQLVG